MSEVRTIGLDLAKNVFQIHGADETGAVVFRKPFRRGQVLKFFGGLQQCVVAMEACGNPHFWAREIGRLGHETNRFCAGRICGLLRVWRSRTAIRASHHNGLDGNVGFGYFKPCGDAEHVAEHIRGYAGPSN